MYFLILTWKAEKNDTQIKGDQNFAIVLAIGLFIHFSYYHPEKQ